MPCWKDETLKEDTRNHSSSVSGAITANNHHSRCHGGIPFLFGTIEDFKEKTNVSLNQEVVKWRLDSLKKKRKRKG